MSINIAIDGPSGAGKSTLSKALAAELGYVYVDTGAIYRCVGLYALERDIAPSDAAAVTAALPDIQVDLRYAEGIQHMLLCGQDVTDRIRTPAVSQAASTVSAIPAVRAYLLEMQRKIAREQNCIMDGRDIGTVVLPQADVKIFLSASAEERARRRHKELTGKGSDISYERVLAEMQERDARDSSREAAPMVPAADAIPVDTTELDFAESLAYLSRLIQERLAAR